MWDLFQAFLIKYPVLTTIVVGVIIIALRLFRLNFFRNVFRDNLRHWLKKPKPTEQDPSSFKKESL